MILSKIKSKLSNKKENINFLITTAYRDYNFQSVLYNNYVKADGIANADTYSARPGYSEHQFGYSFDLTDENYADFDEFDEKTMDGLGESYFKKVYENIESFKTTAVKTSGNAMIIEGLLKFDSGNEKSTSFIFESLDATKHGKFRFVGDNKELTEGKKAFMLTGTIKENKLMLESLNYNYKHTDEEGNTSRVYGTERIAKGE